MDCHRISSTGGPPTKLSSNSMAGGWAQRAYHMSWDGKWTFVNTFSGFQMIQGTAAPRSYRVELRQRNVQWAPDSKHFLIWAGEGIAVCDVDNLGAPDKELTTTIVYKAPWPKGRRPFGAGWSPDGKHVFVIEHVDNPDKPGETSSSIKRFDAGGGGEIEILKHPTVVRFFMPPISRYEDGSGPSRRDYMIAFGARDGLYVMDRNGQNKERISDAAPDGVNDIIWNPGEKDKFLVLFRTPGHTVSGKTLQGVYLVHVDRRATIKKGQEDQLLEQVDDRLDIHTVWFSRTGKYLGWANHQDLTFRDPDGAAKSGTKILAKDLGGGEIKGFSFDHKEERLAIACGNRLYVHELAKKATTLVTEVPGPTFVAEPFWQGEDIVFSTFTNTAKPKKRDAIKPAAPTPTPAPKAGGGK